MIENGTGGSQTRTGLIFEQRTDIEQLFRFRQVDGYELIESNNRTGYEIWFQGNLLAHCFKKRELYRFLEQELYRIDWQDHLSKSLEPDNALLVVDTLYIIEVKFQQVPGSVDEKLQTCDFKRKQYSKLVRDLNWSVEYVYVLNDWFRKPEYRDTLDYIHAMNCHYLFNEIPLEWLHLPHE